MALKSFLKLIPDFRDYLWGGDRLRPGHSPTAEAWVVWEENRIESGILAGKTLGYAAATFGSALLGERAFVRTGLRFPLLIKLLDCAQWLSLQVHPNDEQAIQLEGPNQYGKTEAWYVLEALPESELIAGVRSGISSVELAESIRKGTITDHSQYVNVSQGDTIFMPAGTLHALGPGLLVYEVQQTSDWTYRVYDWGRPQTESRQLHIDKSIKVTRPDFSAPVIPLPVVGDGSSAQLVQCEYFTLELLVASLRPIQLDTRGETFHAITVIEGKASLNAAEGRVDLEKMQTALVPASLGEYEFLPLENCRALKSSV